MPTDSEDKRGKRLHPERQGDLLEDVQPPDVLHLFSFHRAESLCFYKHTLKEGNFDLSHYLLQIHKNLFDCFFCVCVCHPEKFHLSI